MFSGVIAPVTTPFTPHGELDLSAFRRNLAKYAASPLSGCLVAGTTGEGIHLTLDEKMRLLQEAEDCLPDDRSLMLGISSPSLRGALEQLEEAQKHRLDAVLVAVPNYYRSRMTEPALEAYYRAVADHASVPVLLYNIPQLTGLELSLALVERLAAHPRVAGMKESSGNLIYLQGVLSRTEHEQFQVISGSAETCGLARPIGVECGILAIGCVVPEMTAELLTAAGAEFKSAQEKVFSLASVVVRGLGVPGVKFAMDLCGWAGMHCRAPLSPLTADEMEHVRSVMKRAGCL